MSERKNQSNREFLKLYIPLQKAGKSRKECAIGTGFETDERGMNGFNTKLSNSSLEFFVDSTELEVDGEPVSGYEYVRTFRDSLPKVPGKEPGSLVPVNINKAYRKLRALIEKGGNDSVKVVRKGDEIPGVENAGGGRVDRAGMVSELRDLLGIGDDSDDSAE